MKISLITVCYNSAKTIAETFESVLSQSYDNYEYIVVDGKSSDDTINIIVEYEKKFKGKMHYISEKDNGLYDAMNKGIKLATGEIIGILNSDDKFSGNAVLEKIAKEFKKTNCDALYSNLLFMDHEKMMFPVRKVIAGKVSKKLGWHPPHPTLYIKKSVYNEIGLFNLKYKKVSDYDLMLRLVRSNFGIVYINEFLIYMRAGGLSTNGLKGYINNFKESYQILKDNKIKFAFVINVHRSIKTICQMITAKFMKIKV